MRALRLTALFLATLALSRLSVAQSAATQETPAPAPATSQPAPAEPALPVVTENVCPFEGCIFRQWTVTKDSDLFSTWHDDRRKIGDLKQNEKVLGLTGVYLTRQPGRYLVLQAIPALSLKPGDAILEYTQYGEGYSDAWMNGKWFKDFGWGQEDNASYRFTEENLKQVSTGVKEWWVQVRKSDDLTGWVLADNNFGNMDQLGGGNADEAADVSADAKPTEAPPLEPAEPELPVVNEDACPGNNVVPRWKITREAPIFSSWKENDGDPIIDLQVDQQVNVIGGVNLTIEPDRLLVTKPIPDLALQPDDVLLRYSKYKDGTADVWTSGTWHKQFALLTVEKDATSPRPDFNSVVIKNGVKEWWVQVRTSTGLTGWVLAYRLDHDEVWDSGNFDNLCPSK